MCNCQSPRIASVQGRVADMCELEIPHLGIKHDGYVPNNLGIGSGDYLFFSYCLTCGQIENFKPCSDEQVANAIAGDFPNEPEPKVPVQGKDESKDGGLGKPPLWGDF